MKLNVLKLSHLVRPRTHEGAPAVPVSSDGWSEAVIEYIRKLEQPEAQ